MPDNDFVDNYFSRVKLTLISALLVIGQCLNQVWKASRCEICTERLFFGMQVQTRS